MTTIEKYRKIVSELIRRSFPVLKSKKIKVIEYNFFHGYAFYLPVINVIGINKKCSAFSDKEKKGLLVHELCHAEQSNNVGFLKNILWFISYWIFSRKIKKKTEIEADKLVIKKGYAKNLFVSTKKFESEFEKMRYGFSLKQIKSYAKKIGKWP